MLEKEGFLCNLLIDREVCGFLHSVNDAFP